MTPAEVIVRARAALQASRDARFGIKPVACPPPERPTYQFIRITRERFPSIDDRLRLALDAEAFRGALQGCEVCGERLGHFNGCEKEPEGLRRMEMRPNVYAVSRRTMADKIRSRGL